MKVLFDHNVPHKLRRSLPGHDVSTADEMGWSQLENGRLLSAAEREGFAALVTGDKNLSYQQNLTGRQFVLVVLSTNNWRVIRENPDVVAKALDRATVGSFERLQFANRLKTL